ncbi:hypothetical protein [Roseomonas mucosa]|uniref:hypothetical protein n=1 Tax=Roseomonas mucosa TaxID=207340 RepID=UPI002246E3C0|nr:hypothetical protein [Roseomonas mucosa]UZO91720.1 hypothetical protein RMP42_06027 [Roseomonas mucosa]
MSRDPLADVQSPDFQLQMQLAALEWKLRQVRKRNRRERLARRIERTRQATQVRKDAA